MTKLKSFVWLDFVTIKPYFTPTYIVLFAVMALFLTMVSGNISSGIGVGMMLGTMFIGYPFALSEKSNMDALYATLSVNRKTVVLGRYMFALVFNVCAMSLCFVLASVGLLGARVADFGNEVGEVLWIVLLLAVLFAVIQAIQLPLYFKFGYTKAKFLSLIPFVAIMAGYVAFISMGSDNGSLNNLNNVLTEICNDGIVIVPVVLALFFIIFVSYRLSLVFYENRDF
jgi:hypothetical protein